MDIIGEEDDMNRAAKNASKLEDEDKLRRAREREKRFPNVPEPVPARDDRPFESNQVTQAVRALARSIEYRCPAGPAREAALHHLEIVSMFATKSIYTMTPE
jgi:hypothetical protein